MSLTFRIWGCCQLFTTSFAYYEKQTPKQEKKNTWMTQWADDVNNFMLHCIVGVERCVSSGASFPGDLAQKPCLLYFSAWVIAVKCSLKIIAPPLEGAAICPSVIAWPALTWRTEEDDGPVTADWGMTSHKIESPKCLQALSHHPENRIFFQLNVIILEPQFNAPPHHSIPF